MASGVRLCVVVLVCWVYTRPSSQDKLAGNSSSKLFTFYNETDKNIDSESQKSELLRNGINKYLNLSVRVPAGVFNHVPHPARGNKGERPNTHLSASPSEIDDMLKGEPVINEVDRMSMENKNNVLDKDTKENVDPAYQEEELKITKSQMENQIFGMYKNRTINEKNIKPRIKRSEQSTVVNSLLLPAHVTTEVADLIEAGSEDQEVAAGHKSHKWSKGGGHKYKKDHHKKGGHKGDKGYKTKHHHKKGEHEKHGKDEHKKHYKKKSGHKKKHHDEAEKYGEHHKKEKGHKGAKYGEKKGHKKGHKTKGYHHKFHKDEYKKEHKFYDDYHKKGHHDKHGHHHKHHAKKAGKHKKGGHHKSAYHKDKYGKKGHKEGGHYDQEHKGHKGKKGHKKYHEHHSSHGKKGGHKEGKKWGFSKKHKHHKH